MKAFLFGSLFVFSAGNASAASLSLEEGIYCPLVGENGAIAIQSDKDKKDSVIVVEKAPPYIGADGTLRTTNNYEYRCTHSFRDVTYCFADQSFPYRGFLKIVGDRFFELNRHKKDMTVLEWKAKAIAGYEYQCK